MKSRFSAAAVALLIGAGLLAFPAQVGQAVVQGLSACAATLIPSLFPFMALCSFIALADLGALLALPLAPLLRRAFGLPRHLGGLLLSGFVGGYPVAASCMANLIDQKKMPPETAARLLTMCTNAGPTFVISIAGARVLGSVQAGVLLFGAQCLSALVTGFIFTRGTKLEGQQAGGGLPLAPALVQGVCNAANAMLAICGFYITFCALVALLSASGLLPLTAGWLQTATGGLLDAKSFSCLLQGLLEVTCGLLACAGIAPDAAVLLVPLLLGFSSLSVFCQVAACLQGRGVSLRPFALSRLLHGLLTTLFALPALRLWAPASTWAWASATISPATRNPANVAIGSVCLMAMCAILLFSAEHSIAMKSSKNNHKLT